MSTACLLRAHLTDRGHSGESDPVAVAPTRPTHRRRATRIRSRCLSPNEALVPIGLEVARRPPLPAPERCALVVEGRARPASAGRPLDRQHVHEGRRPRPRDRDEASAEYAAPDSIAALVALVQGLSARVDALERGVLGITTAGPVPKWRTG